MVTHHIVQYFPVTSKQKFRFGLPRPGQAKTELLFCSQWEVLHNLMCHPVLMGSVSWIGALIRILRSVQTERSLFPHMYFDVHISPSAVE